MHKAFVCGLNQLLRLFIHLADVEGFVEVTMETVVVDGDVHCARGRRGGKSQRRCAEKKKRRRARFAKLLMKLEARADKAGLVYSHFRE